MSSGSSASLSEASAEARSSTSPGRRSSSLSLTEKQTQAYLEARDALRRLRRASALLAALPNAGPQPLGAHEATIRPDGT